MTAVVAGRLDLLAVIEYAKVHAPAPPIHGSPAHGLAGRPAEFELARGARVVGLSETLARLDRVHDLPGYGHRAVPADMLSADLRCDCDRYYQCGCVGDQVSRRLPTLRPGRRTTTG